MNINNNKKFTYGKKYEGPRSLKQIELDEQQEHIKFFIVVFFAIIALIAYVRIDKNFSNNLISDGEGYGNRVGGGNIMPYVVHWIVTH